MEQKVLASLYDRLWQAITYSPGGGKEATFDRKTTFVQFSKGEALNPADFANAVTPTNPGGNLNAAQTFSQMVDVIPAVQADYAPSASKLSDNYEMVVNGANSSVETDPKQQEIYDKAYEYLNTSTTVKDFTGKEVTTHGPSSIHSAYENNKLTYTAALSAYRTAYLGYDMSDPKQQRQFQANAPLLQAAIDKTYNEWRAAGAAQVEQALAALDTTVNSAVRNVIEAAQRTMRTAAFESSTGDGTKWYLSYMLPTNWADPSGSENFSALTLKSSFLETTKDSSFSSYGGGASWFGGLWGVGGSAAGSSGSTHYHMDADSLELSAKLGVVRIYRPWLNDLIFKMNKWFVDNVDKDGISNGKLQGNESSVIPLIPTAFIVAREIEITADFTSEDKKHVESSVSGSASVGWGPFRISGHYSHSSSKDTFTSTFDGGTLKVPGMQIVAWVSEIVPASPPENAP
ncbi:MAG: hypothetical protein BA869_04920 [Desulfuromonadales bacterium C00003107]|jgi:hypothetical protein|nr:MAG: hypothetical protein BA869_04920 [Desulfuromonadales bacterium C00003107]